MPDCMPTSITAAQVEARRKGIGASDAKRIMDGDLLSLWSEKTGRAEPEDLSDKLQVQLGVWTEPFNAFWYEKISGNAVDRSEAVKAQTYVHPAFDWMLCHLDGLTQVLDARKPIPWEAKHTNPFGQQDAITQTYYAQLQHQMEVTGADEAVLSVLYGNSAYRWFRVERDPDYIAQLIERERLFWEAVQSDTPPEDAAAVAAPDPDRMRVVDMTADNMWGDNEATWLQHRAAVQAFKAAESALKALIPADAKMAFGRELVIVRSRDNKLTIRTPTKADAKLIAQHKETPDR